MVQVVFLYIGILLTCILVDNTQYGHWFDLKEACEQEHKECIMVAIPLEEKQNVLSNLSSVQ